MDKIQKPADKQKIPISQNFQIFQFQFHYQVTVKYYFPIKATEAILYSVQMVRWLLSLVTVPIYTRWFVSH